MKDFFKALLAISAFILVWAFILPVFVYYGHQWWEFWK